MARRRFHLPNAAQPAGLTPRTDAGLSMFGGGSFSTGFQGARRSDQRGYIYWNSLEPDRELMPWTRIELMRKAHALYANTGLARQVINGIAALVIGPGGMQPQARTEDSAFNAAAEKRYKNRARSKATYDAAGRHSGSRMQRMAVRSMLLDGDCAIIYSRASSGNLQRALRSGWQIGNSPDTKLDQSLWTDGVRLDSMGRPVAYRFPGPNKSFVDVKARDLSFLAKYDMLGATRGVSALAHAVNKMIDISEIRAAVVQGIKTSNQIAYYIAKDAGAKASAGLGRNASTAAGAGTTVRTASTATSNLNMTQKMLLGTGGNIPEMPEGVDIKTLLDTRPHPNAMEFEKALIRDIAAGTGLKYEILWEISALGGANTRYALAEAQQFISQVQQDLVDDWLYMDWVLDTATAMSNGELPTCSDPEWWKHAWVPPGRITVDFGRDGKAHQEFIRSGMLTLERYHSLQGHDAREEMIKQIELIAWAKKEAQTRGLKIEEVFPALMESRFAAEAQLLAGDSQVPAKIVKSPEDDDED